VYPHIQIPKPELLDLVAAPAIKTKKTIKIDKMKIAL
jgi:hypothetical protein